MGDRAVRSPRPGDWRLRARAAPEVPAPRDPAAALRGARLRVPPRQGAEGPPLRPRRPPERLPRRSRSSRPTVSWSRRPRRRRPGNARRVYGLTARGEEACAPGWACQRGAGLPRPRPAAVPRDRHRRTQCSPVSRATGRCSTARIRRCRRRRRGPAHRWDHDCAPQIARGGRRARTDSPRVGGRRRLVGEPVRRAPRPLGCADRRALHRRPDQLRGHRAHGLDRCGGRRRRLRLAAGRRRSPRHRRRPAALGQQPLRRGVAATHRRRGGSRRPPSTSAAAARSVSATGTGWRVS